MDEVTFAVTLLCITALAIQWSHYHFKKSERDYVDAFRMSEELEVKLILLEDLKKQVDTLNLRAGFKL